MTKLIKAVTSLVEGGMDIQKACQIVCKSRGESEDCQQLLVFYISRELGI
jgi:hypothetical protein